jgi:predicted nuclease of predicted toxin-antitoxin system
MKVVLDQGLPRSAVQHLAAAGIPAVHVGELGMASATDEAILDETRRQQAVIVTLDADFHRLLAVTGGRRPQP